MQGRASKEDGAGWFELTLSPVTGIRMERRQVRLRYMRAFLIDTDVKSLFGPRRWSICHRSGSLLQRAWPL